MIKVEPPGVGDLSRLARYESGGITTFAANTNRGKRSIQIDLSTDEGVGIVLDLFARADVVVQAMRPGVVDRLGIGYEHARRVNPSLVYCSLSGYGPDGPHADRPVYDPILQARAGYVAIQVNPEIPIPDLVRNAVVDKAAGWSVANAVLAALFARERGAGGQHVEVAMLDAAVAFLWPDAGAPHTLVDVDAEGTPLSQIYQLTPTADGHLVYFVITDAQFCGLYRALGRPHWCEDERYATHAGRTAPGRYEELGAELAAAFLEWPTDRLVDRLHAEGVPAARVQGVGELPDDPQIRHNATFAEWVHPRMGRIRQPRPVARFSATPTTTPTLIDRAGEHTDAILTELGLDEAERRRLRDAGVVAGPT
ncbi:MAG: CoA transferase [Actinomyces sp.]|nr:MAG: CoA transferase [Actinomyces sp.]